MNIYLTIAISFISGCISTFVFMLQKDKEKPKISAKGEELPDIGDVEDRDMKQIEITLNKSHSAKRWALIPVSWRYRHFFPGFKVWFEFETDVGVIRTRVTSAPFGTERGNPSEGKYIQGGLGKWYRAHPELMDGDTLLISVVEPHKRYRLSIKD